MSTTAKITLSVAIVVGAASAALANEPTGQDRGGYRVQSWQSIQQASHATDAYHAYGFVSPNQKHGFVVASPKHRVSREND